jgi:hypothetical protein
MTIFYKDQQEQEAGTTANWRKVATTPRNAINDQLPES